MAADIKLYTNLGCTEELVEDESGSSIFVLSPLLGVNGYTGDKHTTAIYLKNVGNRAALNVYLYNKQDVNGFINMSLSEHSYEAANTSLYIGDIPVGGKVTVYISIQVPRGTDKTIYFAPLTLDYYSLPTMDYVFYNPYHKNRYKSASKYRVYIKEIPMKSGLLNTNYSVLIDTVRYTLDNDNSLILCDHDGDNEYTLDPDVGGV